MRRTGAVKFPNSVQLFKFCHKVLADQRGGKVNDQEVGVILNFNPSDCSHWKRGEKNVRSVFALSKLSETLQVEESLLHDVVVGNIRLDEAFFEYSESRSFSATLKSYGEIPADQIASARRRIESFVAALHAQSHFTTPPLYLPEVTRFFPFVATQPAEMMDKLSRILRVKTGSYCIQFQRGDLKPQTRMSIAKDLARIILEAERDRFPELGPVNADLIGFETLAFIAALLVPKHMLVNEMARLDARKNIVHDLATAFWAPKSLVCYQMQDIVRAGESLTPVAHQESTEELAIPTMMAPPQPTEGDAMRNRPLSTSP